MIIRPVIRNALILVLAAALVSWLFKIGADNFVAEQLARPVHAATIRYAPEPVRYAPRVEVYTETGVFIFNDTARPGGYLTLGRCRGRLLEMRDFIKKNILPELAKTEKIERWRGVCVDALEATNQTTDA